MDADPVTAHHEAAHAVTAIALGFKVNYATMALEEGYEGSLGHSLPADGTRDAREIPVCLAGIAAELRLTGSFDLGGCRRDILDALSWPTSLQARSRFPRSATLRPRRRGWSRRTGAPSRGWRRRCSDQRRAILTGQRSRRRSGTRWQPSPDLEKRRDDEHGHRIGVPEMQRAGEHRKRQDGGKDESRPTHRRILTIPPGSRGSRAALSLSARLRAGRGALYASSHGFGYCGFGACPADGRVLRINVRCRSPSAAGGRDRGLPRRCRRP